MSHFMIAFVTLSLLFFQSVAVAQPDGFATVPLTVEQGVRLEVILSNKVEFKTNQPVRATVTEPVYAFDREVIPVGAQLEGTVKAVHSPGKWKRVSAMLGGDFTPLKEPEIAFHTLVLKSGARIPIETAVVPGTERIIDAAAAASTAAKNSLVSTVKPQNKLVSKLLWGLSPVHPQYAPAGTPLAAVLMQPLDFGEAEFDSSSLDSIGSELPADTVYVGLVSRIDSRTARVGTPVQGVVLRPVFSREGKLVYPVGSRLDGKVILATPARKRHRNGELSFSFTTITPAGLWLSKSVQAVEVDSRLVGIQVGHEMKDLRIGDTNTARIFASKKRFIGPAWAAIKAGRAFSASADSFDEALLGAYRGKFLRQVTGSDGSGFGLPAGVSGAMIPPIGIGLSLYSAARSFYSNFLGRGRDISLPESTEMQIRMTKRVPIS